MAEITVLIAEGMSNHCVMIVGSDRCLLRVLKLLDLFGSM